jgi:hypothetical protein
MEVIQSVANGSLEIHLMCVLFLCPHNGVFFLSLVAENEYRWTVTSERAVERWMGGLFM